MICSARAVDTATDPSYRGRGLFTTLTRALIGNVRDDGEQFIFNTPNDQSRPGYLKMGWQIVRRVPVWARPLHAPGGLGRVLRTLSGRVPEAGEGTDWGVALPELSHHDLITLGQSRTQLSVVPRTDHAVGFLRWRYAECPAYSYSSAISPVDPGCSVVYRTTLRRGLRELRICELIASSTTDSRQHAARLMRELCDSVPADVATAVAPAGSPEALILSRAGFVRVPWLGPKVTVLPLSDSSFADPLAITTWRLSAGDMELF
jgi:hypothetical protein